MQYQQAKNIAVSVCEKLQPYTTKLHIAGSIRRKKPEVKDAEIVCLPKMEEISSQDLFGGGKKELVVSPGFIETANSLGEIIKGKPTGRYMQIKLHEGINLDLFIPEPEDFYRQYAIRTGSADYAFKIIATGWRKKGWVGSDLGLRLASDCIETKQPDGKSKWTCVRNKDNKPPVWQSEAEFFEWIGVPFVSPEFRNM